MPQYPTQGQIANSVPVKEGALSENRFEDGYLFASGIIKPEHSNVLSVLFPQYFVTALFDEYITGGYEGLSDSAWTWSELDRTRKGAQITATTALPNAAPTLTTSIDTTNTPGSAGYYLVGDIVRTETGTNLRVTAIGLSGSFQTITVEKMDKTDVQDVVDLSVNDRIGHIGSAFGERSSAPGSRTFLPQERSNKFTTLRRTLSVSGTALTDRTWLEGGESWYYTDENIFLNEFAGDRERTLMWGQETPNQAGFDTIGDGILEVIETGGVTSTFTGSVTEADLQAQMKALMKVSPSKEWLVIAGTDYLGDVSNALKDYQLNGAVSYGMFGQNKPKGLEIDSYKFLGCTIHFAHYEMFDDVETLPFNSTATATKKNYSNYSAWFNMGVDPVTRKKLISLKYKELNGNQRKFIYKTLDGMPSPGSSVATGDDAHTALVLSEIGAEVRNLNNHGVQYAIG